MILRRAHAPSASICPRGTPRSPRWRRRWGVFVGDFSVEWLAMREPADHAARSAALARAVAELVQPGPGLRVLDLGAGTGSNARYLAARLPRPQRWLLVDRDATLL